MVDVAERARAADEHIARARSRDHLQRVLVTRRVNERRDGGGGARERAVERDQHPPVSTARDILSRYPLDAGDRIRRADEGEGNPEPRVDVSQGEDVILAPEVLAVRPSAHERMVGYHDNVTL